MRLLSLTFQLDLPARDIAGFRGALARAAGFEQDIFHNHDGEGSKLHYRYPLVQYRSDRGQAGIVGMDAGADAILQWYSDSGGELVHNDQTHRLIFEKIDIRQCEIEYYSTPRSYTLRQWLPLNQARYEAWRNMPTLGERIAELERLLAANILTFCRAVGWRLPQKFDLRISEITRTYTTGFLGNRHIAFDLSFTSTLRLPYGIGLGKAVSHGFGVCRPLRAPRRKKQTEAQNNAVK